MHIPGFGAYLKGTAGRGFSDAYRAFKAFLAGIQATANKKKEKARCARLAKAGQLLRDKRRR